MMLNGLNQESKNRVSNRTISMWDQNKPRSNPARLQIHWPNRADSSWRLGWLSFNPNIAELFRWTSQKVVALQEMLEHHGTKWRIFRHATFDYRRYKTHVPWSKPGYRVQYEDKHSSQSISCRSFSWRTLGFPCRCWLAAQFFCKPWKHVKATRESWKSCLDIVATRVDCHRVSFDYSREPLGWIDR